MTEMWRKDNSTFTPANTIRLYNLYVSFQTRKGIPPIRWPEICGYITFTQVVRHGKVYRRSDVWKDGGKMADISASEHICGYIIFTQAFRHGKVYRRSVGRKYAVIQGLRKRSDTERSTVDPMSRIIWRKDGRDFRQRAQCGYVMYTQAFRHGKVYRRSVGRKYAVI